MHKGDKQPSILRTIYTPGAGAFLLKVFEWEKLLLPFCMEMENLLGPAAPPINLYEIRM